MPGRGGDEDEQVAAGLQSGQGPLSVARRPPPQAAPQAPEDAGKAEEAPLEGGPSLEAETRAWFRETQAHGLLQDGAAPPWFHGFITRR